MLEFRPPGGNGRPVVVSILDSGRDVREYQVEHDVGHEQCQAQVERLADDIQDQRLAALEVLFQLTEVGRQSDCCKGQAEEPAAEDTREAAQHALIDHRETGVRAQAAVNH